jgi:hypothetical protein
VAPPIELTSATPTRAFAGSTFDAVFLFVRDRRLPSTSSSATRPNGGIVKGDEPPLSTHRRHHNPRAARHPLRVPNGWIGRRLRAMFVDRGLEDVELRLFTIQSTSFAEWTSRVGIERAVGRAIELGRVAEAGAAAWLAELRERDARGRFFATGMFFMAAGTKRDRPGSGAQA